MRCCHCSFSRTFISPSKILVEKFNEVHWDPTEFYMWFGKSCNKQSNRNAYWIDCETKLNLWLLLNNPIINHHFNNLPCRFGNNSTTIPNELSNDHNNASTAKSIPISGISSSRISSSWSFFSVFWIGCSRLVPLSAISWSICCNEGKSTVEMNCFFN